MQQGNRTTQSSLLGECLKNYNPFTIWAKTFQDLFHPQVFVGCNVEDEDIESDVLNRVGSYGMQIGDLLKIMDVCVAHLPENLTPEEEVVKLRFKDYREQVAAALLISRGVPEGFVPLVQQGERVLKRLAEKTPNRKALLVPPNPKTKKRKPKAK